ncbi:MAG: twin-arginine translocase TatA/TatE family subunit [Candidatus Korobacteraceae bacterium]
MFDGLFQPMHLIVILFIALLVFGPKKLPELGKGLGDGIRSFKDSMRNREEAFGKADETTPSASGTSETVSGQPS